MAKKINSSNLRIPGDLAWAKKEGRCAVCGMPAGLFVYCDACSGEATGLAAYATILDEEVADEEAENGKSH